MLHPANDLYCIIKYYYRMLFVFIIDYHKSLEQKIVVKNDIPFAQRSDNTCKSACGDNSAFLSKLFLDTFHKSVNGAGI